MSVKPETTFIASVHRHLPSRHEPYREKNNNPYRGGTPDVFYSGTLAPLWVEYKFLPSVPQRGIVWLCKPDVKVPILSVLQREWLRGRYEEGREVAVIVGCPTGGVIMRNLSWENAWPVGEFREALLDRKALAGWVTQQTIG